MHVRVPLRDQLILREGGRLRPRRVAVEALESRRLLSHTFFVATTGRDAGPGTLARPFRTIQEAANAAHAGDTVEIEGGTYRQTVTPRSGGVTFRSYNGQTVILTGTDTVGGWSSDGGAGSVYLASMPSDLGEGNNQVFVDGQMINEARWPNDSANLSHPVESTVGSYSNGTLYDPAITQGAGYWAGATITITPGDAWVAYTGTVTDSGPGWLAVSLPAPSLPEVEQPVAGNSYFLSGTLNALDAPGEWYRDDAGTLHLLDSQSDSPAAGHDVEVKARQYAFDLSGVSDTTIRGIELFACTIATDAGSTNTTLDAIDAAYVTHSNNLGISGWHPQRPNGIELNGDGSTLENSTIAFGATDGVYVGGANVTVANNVIHDVDYSGADGAGVRVDGPGTTVQQNTIYNVARDGINLQAPACQVLDDVVHDFMLQTYDGAAVYAFNVDGQGTVIAGNTLFDAHKNNYAGLDADGILLDGDSSRFVIHDNVTANVDAGFKANNTSLDEQIYDNQFGGIQFAMETNGWTGFAYDWSGSQVYGNVYYNPNVELGANVTASNNTQASGSPAIDVPTPPDTPIPTPAPSFVSLWFGSPVAGTFRAAPAIARSATSYTLNATAALAGFGTFRLTGTAIRLGKPAGTIRLKGAGGAATLVLTAPAAANSGEAPYSFTYALTQTSGALKQFAGSGTLALTFTPVNSRGTLGTFTLASE